MLNIQTINRVCTITLPGKWLDFHLVQALQQNLEALETADDIKVIVIQGTATSFCEGYAPQYLTQLLGLTVVENIGDSAFFGQLCQLISRHKKLIVAAVQGKATQEGCTLARCADFVVTDSSSELGWPDIKWGQIPAMSMVFALPKVGEANLRRLLLTGRTLTATEAVAQGVADEVAPQGTTAQQFAQQFAAQLVVQNAIGPTEFIKKLAADLPKLPMKEALEFAAKINAHGRFTHEYAHGLQSRLSNTEPPTW